MKSNSGCKEKTGKFYHKYENFFILRIKNVDFLCRWLYNLAIYKKVIYSKLYSGRVQSQGSVKTGNKK